MEKSKERKSTLVHDALILFIITLISGIGLGAVYGVTKGPIETANYNSQQEAYATVFTDASNFEELEESVVSDAQAYIEEQGSEDTVGAILEAKDDSGEVLGYVIKMTSHAGYGGDIEFSLGIQNDGTLNGYSITSISETAGLGMKAKEDDFASQFVGKNVEEFSVTKTGSTSDSEIDAITGATITSRAMTNAINSGLMCFRYITEGGAE